VHWTGSFYGLCVLGLGTAAVKGHKPHLLAPLIPLGFVVGEELMLIHDDTYAYIIILHVYIVIVHTMYIS